VIVRQIPCSHDVYYMALLIAGGIWNGASFHSFVPVLGLGTGDEHPAYTPV